VTHTETFQLRRPFFLEVLLIFSLLRYGKVWPWGTVKDTMSSSHALNIGQAEVSQEILNLGCCLQLLYRSVCSAVSNRDTARLTTTVYTAWTMSFDSGFHWNFKERVKRDKFVNT
jgi:hypothetical protein